MNKYYRVQPRGLGIEKNHSSEGCTGCGPTPRGICVFDAPFRVFDLDYYEEGFEVIEIEAPDSWDAGDYEGSRVDPGLARITRRWSYDEFARACGHADFADARENRTDDDQPQLQEVR